MHRFLEFFLYRFLIPLFIVVAASLAIFGDK